MSDNTSPFDGLVEHELRRPDFVGGVPVKLLDGNEYYFAEPKMRMAPSGHDLGFQVIHSLDDDGTFNDLYERHQVLVLMRDKDESTAMEQATTEIRLGAMMLLRNYNMTQRQLTRVLQISHNPDKDPIAFGIRQEIFKIILGDVPKPLAGGDEPSLTPPAC